MMMKMIIMCLLLAFTQSQENEMPYFYNTASLAPLYAQQQQARLIPFRFGGFGGFFSMKNELRQSLRDLKTLNSQLDSMDNRITAVEANQKAVADKIEQNKDEIATARRSLTTMSNLIARFEASNLNLDTLVDNYVTGCGGNSEARRVQGHCLFISTGATTENDYAAATDSIPMLCLQEGGSLAQPVWMNDVAFATDFNTKFPTSGELWVALEFQSDGIDGSCTWWPLDTTANICEPNAALGLMGIGVTMDIIGTAYTYTPKVTPPTTALNALCRL